MEWITGMQKAIDYIEANLTEEIDYEKVAAESFSSSYHFQRVFSILCGYTLGEYIRLRRLSLAGADLANGKEKVIDIALRYGYDSPDSFAKAFQKFHGITPSQARADGNKLNSFSRLSIKISLEGGSTMNYRIEEKPSLVFVGHKVRCTGSPTNADNAHIKTTEHWISSRDIQRKMKTIRKGNLPIWYDLYSDFTDNDFSHTIAVETDDQATEKGLEVVWVPSHKYAIFETEQGVSPDEKWASVMKRIASEWLPNTDYVMSNHPQINKQYFETDPTKRYMEIWIPIEKK